MKKFIISFNYNYTVINLELMLAICNSEEVQLVRVYVDKAKKAIEMYVEAAGDEERLYEMVKEYSIYKCNIVEGSEKKLLSECNWNSVVIFEMKYKYDIYNMYMLKKICD